MKDIFISVEGSQIYGGPEPVKHTHKYEYISQIKTLPQIGCLAHLPRYKDTLPQMGNDITWTQNDITIDAFDFMQRRRHLQPTASQLTWSRKVSMRTLKTHWRKQDFSKEKTNRPQKYEMP